MNQKYSENQQAQHLELAEKIREECIKAAWDGFTDASISGLCTEGAMEAAISAIQKLDVDQIVNDQTAK
jgi:hypothetical protein